ncbi:MFS transporter [Paenibacillus sp. PR3]|uniref:MFS transporter n=1 Tax=Paenibacillus terricola TaxID=2763503 RepID=A0ABR8MMW1_9BACL|nr:MFS transporter [Paenibacillus terricola]MBD3917353.1 MFS transporter [Paenibacillus terricola]
MKYYWRVYLLAAGGFLVGTSEFVIAGVLDRIAVDLKIPISLAGQLVTVFSLVFALGTPLLVAVTSRVERKKLLSISLFVFIIGNLLALFSQDISLLMASRVILAVSSGIYTVTALTLAAHLAPVEKKGGVIATVIMGFSSSLIIGVPMGRVIANTFDWHYLFAIVAGGGVLIIIAISKWIPHLEGHRPVSLGIQLSSIKDRSISITLSVTFFWIMGYSIVYTYISPYLLAHTHLPNNWVGIGLFAFGIFSIIGSRFGGYGADRWGTSAMLISSLLLHALVLLLFELTHPSQFVSLILMMLWAGSSWATAPVQQLSLIVLAPQASEILLSLNTSILQIGMAAGAAAGGAIVARFSVIHIGWAGAVSVLIACATAVYLQRSGHRAEKAKQL